MSVFTELFEIISVEQLLILLVGIGIAVKTISELWEWIHKKFQVHFLKESETDRKEKQIADALQKLQNTVDKLEQQNQAITTNVDLITERMQENSRNFIIDKHHYFVYELGAIDEFSLQSLEREYMYYKRAGGNSFIGKLMDDIRQLPILSLSNTVYKMNCSKEGTK